MAQETATPASSQTVKIWPQKQVTNQGSIQTWLIYGWLGFGTAIGPIWTSSSSYRRDGRLRASHRDSYLVLNLTSVPNARSVSFYVSDISLTLAFMILGDNIIKTRDFIAYLPLTEPSCSSCVNRKASMRGCKKLTWVDKRKFVVVGKLYIHAHPRQMISQSRTVKILRPVNAQSGAHAVASDREVEEVLSGVLNMAKKIWVNIAVLRLSFVSISPARLQLASTLRNYKEAFIVIRRGVIILL